MKAFLDQVQAHEREWGNVAYPNRPTLEQILSAHVVVFWQATEPNNTKITISLHQELDEVEKYLTRLVFVSKSGPAQKRYLKAYMDKKPVKVKSVKIEFAVDET